ncbi:MAG: hypothetical protein M5U19_22980 [Microthrixaceae bacterium]|nr:hypothetical protein [Microthrixaceae bacterium]
MRGIASQYGVVVASRSSATIITMLGRSAGTSGSSGAGGGTGAPDGGTIAQAVASSITAAAHGPRRHADRRGARWDRGGVPDA